ncbi:tenascin-X [Calonectris borealis]|uniref:tenascin-X n=1 Tax=Calonectris borealis TaxID=1323832 RepID=UPI003F4C8D5D
MTPGLPLLLLALALRGGTGTPPGSPPGPPCGAAALVAILGRLRELEGQVRALQGQCGDSQGPQAGTGRTLARELCAPAPAGDGCDCPSPPSPPPTPPSPPHPPCPLGCSDQGRCRGGRCRCFPGFTGPHCATPACPPGRGGPRCALDIPSVTPRLATRNQTSFRVTWPRPPVPVDGYQVALIPLDEPAAMTTHELPGSAVTFEVAGLAPGHAFELFIQAQRDQHLGAPGTLRVRTLLAQTLPTHGGSPGSPQGSLGSPASPVAPASPSARGSPASPRFPASPVSRGSPGSPASPRSPVSPESPASPASPESPGSPVSPRLPASPRSPASPQSPVSPPSPWSPVSPASPLSPVLPAVPSLHDLGAKLSSYKGSLLQRLESHLRATNFPLRGNQTVPAVARAILSYLLRRSPALLRHQLLRQMPHPKPQLMPGAAGEALVDLDGLRGHAENVVIRYRLLEEPEGAEGELQVPGDTAVARVPGLVPGAMYRVEVHGVVRGHVSKSYTFLVTAGVGGTNEPPLDWEHMYEMELTEPQGAVAKAVPAPPSEEPPPRPRLGGLIVSHVTPGSVQLEWSVLEGTFDSFTVQYRDVQGQPQALAVDGGSRTVTVPGLSPSRRYKFNLYGVWGRKRIGLISTDAVTAPAPPKEEPPSQPILGELTASHITPDSVQLEWSVPEGTFDSFTVQYRDAQGQPQVLPVDGGSRTVTVPGLSPSRRYKFNLYGVWGRKHLGPVSTDAVTAAAEPEEEPPSQPILGELTAPHVTPDSVQLEWSVPEGSFDSFTVQYKDAQGQPQVLPVDGGSRTVTVPGLSPSRRYKFNLYGVWGRKRLGPVSTDAVTAAAEPEEEPPSQPILGELTAPHVTPDSVQLEWSVPEGTFDSFTVQYKDAQGQPQVLPVDGGSRTVTVPGLSPSRRYKFNLYGVWGRKRLGPVSTDAVTGEAEKEPPSQPILGELTAPHVTPDSIQLEWSVREGTFDSFTVQYKDAQGQPQVLPVDGGSRTVTVPGLSPSRRYKFNLYGVWGRKRLGPISTDAVTAAAEPEEKPPTQPMLGELTASHITPGSVQLEWSVPEGTFDSFTVQYKDAQGQPQVLPVDGGSRTVTVPGLSPSRRYKFNLYGVWGRKRLGPVSTDAVTATAEPEEEPPSQPILGELTVPHVTPDSVQLEWSIPEGTFDSFTVQYKDAQGQPQVLPVDGGSRTVTVPGLSPSRRYKFNLYGVWGRKRLGPISTDAVTAPAPPSEELPSEEPPSQPILGELTASHVTLDSVQLEWSVPEGTFDSFTVQYKDAQGQPQVLPVDGGSRTVTVPGLSPSRRYKFNLYGVWGRKRLGPVSTDAVTAEPEEEPPSQPILGELTASQVTPDSVQLEWSVPEGTFDSFTVQYKDAQGQPQVLPVDGGSRTVTVPGLSPSRRYKFNLYGVWGRKRLGPVSTDAVTAAAEPEEEPPSQPMLGELTASQVTPDSVQLEWSIPEGTFDSFTVQYKDAQGQPQVLPVDGGSRTVTVPGLSPSRRYKFNLYGVWGRKRLGPVSTDAVTATGEPEEEPPSQPILGELTASQVTPDSVQLEWSVPEGTFDSFTVQYKDAQGQPQVLPVDGGSRTVTVPGLSPSRRYKFNLYGAWGRKRLGPISTDAVTAQAPPSEELPSEEPPSQPILGELMASHVTPGSVQLEWSVPEGTFDSFTVQYRDAQGQPQVLPVDGGSRTVTVPGLSPSRRYKFNLYGVWGRKRLGPVSTDAVTAPAPPSEELPSEEPPSQPILGELTASHVTLDSVQLEWSVPEGTFDSFTVQYKDAQGQPQVLPVDGGSRTVTVPGLSPSRRYKFNLYGVWGRKRLGPASTDAVTAAAEPEEEPPSQPILGELTASQVTPDSVQLEWSVPEGTFDSFTVQYKDAQGQPQVLPVDGGSRTVTVPGLSPSRRYKFNLYGVWGRKRLGPVSTDAVTAAAEPEEEPPSQPILGELTASQVTPDSVQLEWSVPEGTFDSFTVQYKDAQGQPQVLPVDGGSRTVTVPGLSPSRRYKFNLYGVWGRKRLGPVSTDAVTATGEPEEEPPSQPILGELTASQVTPDSVQLEWSVPEGTFDSFTVQYRDAQGQPQVLPVDGGSRTVTVPGLSPSRRYKFNLYGAWGRKRLGPISTDAVTAPPLEELPSEEPPSQPILGELMASHVTPGSVQLEWSVPEGTFDSFTVQYRDAQGQPQVLPVDGGSRTVTVPGLSPSRRYKFNLYGVWGRKRLGPVSTDAVTAPAPPSEELPSEEPPSQPILGELTASHVTPNSIQLEWSVPEGTFDSFTVQYKDAQGQPQVLPVDGGSRTVTVPGLSPSRRYKFNLYGVWGRKRLGPASTDAVTAAAEPEEEPPSQPILGELTASQVTPDSVQLEWSVPEGTFDSFTVQYKDAQGQPQVLPVDGGSRTVTVPGLSPSRRYKFNLYGVWGRKRLGPASTDAVTAAAKPEEEPPSQPILGELMASQVTPGSVQLEWSVPEGTFDSFTVQYKDAQGQPQVLPVDGGSRTVTVPGLSPSRRYKFNLYGVWGRKRLGPVSTDAVTAPAPPSEELPSEEPPSQPILGELTASQVTPDSVQLEWSVPEGSFDSFTVQYKDAQGQPQVLPVDGGSRTVTVPGLSPSRRYKFNLYGVWGRKRLGPVSTDAVTAAAEPVEEPPSQPILGELTASQVTPDSVQLEWSVPEGTFDSFTVQYKDAQGQPQVLPVDGGSRTVTVPGLSPSRRYKFNLYGVWGRKRLGPISTDAVTASAPPSEELPSEEPPSQPILGKLTASHVTPDSVQLEWSVPEGSFDSFTVQYKDAQGQPQVLPVDGGSRTVTVPGLSPSRRYKFNLYGVWGRNHLGPVSTDAVTVAATAEPEEEPPSQPILGELTASQVTPDSVQLEWSIPEGTFDSFTVQYKDAQGQPQVLPVDGGSRTVTVPGLSPSRRYKFNLYGVWGRKRLGPISTDAVTASAPPSEELPSEEPPSQPILGELTASQVTPDSVQLEWSVPEGSFDSFTVQYKDAQGQPQVLPVDGGSRTVTVPGLSPSRRYKFNLYGVWGRKRLGPVSTDAVTAAAEPVEEPPSQPILGELTASHVTHDSVQLEWSVPEGTFDSFTVQYKDAQGQPQVLPVDGGSRTVTVPGLSPSRRYKFNLYGVWGRKRLGPVSTDAVTASAPPSEELPSEEPPSQPILGELTASHVTPDSVQLEWSVPEGTFDSFTVQYRDTQGQPESLLVDGGSRTVTVPGLSPSRRYKFNLYGVWGRNHLGPVSTHAVTATAEPEEEPPSQPILGELTASHVTPDSIQLEWSIPEGTFDSFTVQYKDAQGQPQVLPVDGGSRTVTVPGLSPSRRYKFNLYGVWGRKRLGPVSTDAVTAAAEPVEEAPSQPILGELTAPHVTPDSVQLEWSVPEGTFDSFTVQYKDAQGQPQVLPVDGGSRMVTVPGLSPSRRYKFNLYGVWGRKRLGPASTDAVTASAPPSEELPSEEPPSQPILGELTAPHVTPDSVQLEWSVPEGTFDSFTVQYKDAQGQPQVLPVDGGSRTVTVPGLSPSRRYKFNLYGVWGRKRLGPISTDAVTEPEKEPPSQPMLGELTASQVTPDSVQLEWSVPEGSFDSFTVQYKDAQGQPQVLPVDGGSRTVTVPGLSPSRRYKFNLYGVWGRKRLGPVSTDAVTAAAEPEEEPPSQPILGELTASQVTPDSVQLEWSVPEGTFDSFTVQYRDAQGQPQVLPVDGGSRTVTVPGLSPSRRYKFNLYGVWGRKRLGPVSTDAVTAAAEPEKEPPSQPILGELTAPHVTPDSVQLEWSVPQGTFDSFTVQYKDAQGQPQVLPVFNLYGVWGRKRLGPASTDAVTAPAPQEEEPPSQPRLGELTASQVTPDSVQLEWSVPEGTFDSFTVQYRDTQGQPESLLVDGGSRTVTVPGLSPSRRYNFYLYGVLGQKRLGPISFDTITAPAPPKEEPPSQPRLGELTAPHVTPDSVQLEWSVPEGTFDSFTVQYRDAQGQPQVLPVDGGSRTVTVPGLSPSRRYKFNLYGVWGRKRLGPVSIDTVTGAPGTLWVGTLWPRSARLHWAPPRPPTDGYDLVYGRPGGPQQTLRLPPEATSHQLWDLEPTGRYGVQLWGRGGGTPPTPLEATFDTPPLPHPHPRDCAEEQLNGPGPSRETLVFLGGDPGRPLRVFCDMETDGGGWLVFQRRQDGGIDFWRGWDAYAHGFGNVTGEFWLGNEALHALTLGTPTELRVDLRTPRDAAFARYRDFAVAGAEEHYRLRLGAYSGTAGDALSYHAGSPFSTRDRDPRGRPRPCAVSYTGAWWYHNCHYANLNGRYGTPSHHQGINWFPWKGFEFSIPFTEMKLRPQRD